MGKKGRELKGERREEEEEEERGQGEVEGMYSEGDLLTTARDHSTDNNFKRHTTGIHLHTYKGIYKKKKKHCQSLCNVHNKFHPTFKIKIIPNNPTGIYSLHL